MGFYPEQSCEAGQAGAASPVQEKTADTRFFCNDQLENRLIAIETKANLGLPQLRSEYLYDAQSRRIQKTDYSAWNGSAYATTNSTRFVWDGWLLLAELNADNSVRAYNVHGLDLSQSLQGAGGIGGLLCRIESGTDYLFTFDGNGNVTDVLDTNANVVAHYEFDPFGMTVTQSGSYADQNPWRFSTKQIEPAWNLYYYGSRFYSPSLHTWINRDPIGEMGCVNLLAFCQNNAVDRFDADGTGAGAPLGGYTQSINGNAPSAENSLPPSTCSASQEGILQNVLPQYYITDNCECGKTKLCTDRQKCIRVQVIGSHGQVEQTGFYWTSYDTVCGQCE